MENYKIETLKVEKMLLGEGPHWDAERQTLYFVDIVGNTVGSYCPATGKSGRVKIESDGLGAAGVSLVVPVAGSTNEFIIGHGRSLKKLEWDSVSEKPTKLTTIYDLAEPNNLGGKFNDGKCDSSGRLWAGTMGEYNPNPTAEDKIKGNLYRLDTNGVVTKAFQGVGVSNGLTWSPDNKTFYYIDSYSYRVDAFDYDAPTGKIDNRRPVFDFKKENESGMPDGMAVDSNGNLWVACFFGSKVIQVNPHTGKVLGRILLPTQHITSVAFGGKNLDELYVTSSKYYHTPEQLAAEPDAGAIFRVTHVGARGISAGVPYASNL